MTEILESTELPLISTQVERVRRQTLVFDPKTGEPEYDIELTGGEKIPGWPIYLGGWHLDEFTLARIWAKVRKIALQPFDVDATALFIFDGGDCEFPTRMDLLPNVGMLDNLKLSFTEYTSVLAKRLNCSAIPRFTHLLVEAQQLFKEGLGTDQIIEELFPNELDEVLAQVNSLPKRQRIRKSRELRDKAEHAYKNAAKENRRILKRAAAAKNEAQKLAAELESLPLEERPNLEKNLARTKEHIKRLEQAAAAASLDKWNKRAYRDRLYDGLRKNFPVTKVEHDDDSDVYTIQFEAQDPDAYGNMTVADLCEQAIENWRPRS